MLGSVHDAEDALQEALLGAWRGLARFEARSSLRAWQYRIATNASLDAIQRRPKRVLPIDFPPADPAGGTGEALIEPLGGLRERRNPLQKGAPTNQPLTELRADYPGGRFKAVRALLLAGSARQAGASSAALGCVAGSLNLPDCDESQDRCRSHVGAAPA